MLEKMNDFFKNRLESYDEHMLTEIEGAKEFYPYTAALLPMKYGANVLDLGCGTGLELEYYFALNGKASVVGIDLSPDMLTVLKRKFIINVLKAAGFSKVEALRNWGATYSVKAFV